MELHCLTVLKYWLHNFINYIITKMFSLFDNDSVFFCTHPSIMFCIYCIKPKFTPIYEHSQNIINITTKHISQESTVSSTFLQPEIYTAQWTFIELHLIYDIIYIKLGYTGEPKEPDSFWSPLCCKNILAESKFFVYLHNGCHLS